MKLIHELNSADHRIVEFTHPDALDGVIESPAWGGIRHKPGNAGYTLNTGETIAI